MVYCNTNLDLLLIVHSSADTICKELGGRNSCQLYFLIYKRERERERERERQIDKKIDRQIQRERERQRREGKGGESSMSDKCVMTIPSQNDPFDKHAGHRTTDNGQ